MSKRRSSEWSEVVLTSADKSDVVRQTFHKGGVTLGNNTAYHSDALYTAAAFVPRTTGFAKSCLSTCERLPNGALAACNDSSHHWLECTFTCSAHMDKPLYPTMDHDVPSCWPQERVMLQLICVFTGVERLYPGNPEWLCTSTASGYRLSHGLGCLEGSEMLVTPFRASTIVRPSLRPSA